MGEFVFNRGRLQTQHSYPDTRLGSNGGVGPFARNLALFSAGETPAPISSGDQITWTFVAVGADGVPEVPITPKITGELRITGDLVVVNGSGSPQSIVVQGEIDGTPIGVLFNGVETLADGESATIPIFFETLTSPPTPVGVTSNVEIRLTTTGALGLASAQLDVQEVTQLTG